MFVSYLFSQVPFEFYFFRKKIALFVSFNKKQNLSSQVLHEGSHICKSWLIVCKNMVNSVSLASRIPAYNLSSNDYPLTWNSYFMPLKQLIPQWFWPKEQFSFSKMIFWHTPHAWHLFFFSKNKNMFTFMFLKKFLLVNTRCVKFGPVH